MEFGPYSAEDSPLCPQCRWELLSETEIRRRRWASVVEVSVEVAFSASLCFAALALLVWVLYG